MRKAPTKSHYTRGFTLVEMVVSLGVLSIILIACGSVIVMASRVTGDSVNRNAQQLQAAGAAGQLTDDLNVALNFTQRTSTATTFTVPDRLNAGSPQVVTYSWSGVSGAPLLRQFNFGSSVSILNAVQQFNLSFNSRVMGRAANPSEQLIFSHVTASGSLKDNKMSNTAYGSQYFIPSLPVGTSSYTLTRVRLKLKAGSVSSAAMNVSLVIPDALFRPTGATVATSTVYMAGLSSNYEWIDVPFAGVTNRNPSQPLCIVLTSANGASDIGSVEIDQSLLSILGGAYWSTSSNGGLGWAVGLSTTTALCSVYGTVP